MTRSRFDRVRLAVNLTNLIASVILLVGTGWAISRRAQTDKGFWLDRIYAPVVECFFWYWSLGLAGKSVAALSASIALVLLLVALLFSFKAKVEDWAVMLLGLPFYLLLSVVVFLLLGLISSVIGWLFF